MEISDLLLWIQEKENNLDKGSLSYLRLLEFKAILAKTVLDIRPQIQNKQKIFTEMCCQSLDDFIHILEESTYTIDIKKECCELFYSSFMQWEPLENEDFFKKLQKISSKEIEIQYFLDSIYFSITLKDFRSLTSEKKLDIMIHIFNNREMQWHRYFQNYQVLLNNEWIRPLPDPKILFKITMPSLLLGFEQKNSHLHNKIKNFLIQIYQIPDFWSRGFEKISQNQMQKISYISFDNEEMKKFWDIFQKKVIHLFASSNSLEKFCKAWQQVKGGKISDLLSVFGGEDDKKSRDDCINELYELAKNYSFSEDDEKILEENVNVNVIE